jgi:uncharacterized protein (DUF1330 family)
MFWVAKVEQTDKKAKSHVTAITATTVKKFGHKYLFNIKNQ